MRCSLRDLGVNVDETTKNNGEDVFALATGIRSRRWRKTIISAALR